MRRIVLLLTVVAVMAVMIVAIAVPAFAGEIVEPEPCINERGFVASEGRAPCHQHPPGGGPPGQNVVNLSLIPSPANAASVGIGAPLLVIGGLLAYRMVRSKR